MMRTAENYSPVAVAAVWRRQAAKVWAAALAVVLLWVLATILAPFALAAGSTSLSAPLYGFFSYICHQLPDRSFHVAGEQFGVCSRCFGVYFGLFLGIAIYPLWRDIDMIEPLPRFWLFLSLVPISIDWSLTAFGIWENTQASRFLTGLVLGAACATFIIPALIEVTRNLTRGRSPV